MVELSRRDFVRNGGAGIVALGTAGLAGCTSRFLYESEGAADVEALREHVDINRDVGDRWGTLTDYEVDASGRVLVVSGTIRTRSLLF